MTPEQEKVTITYLENIQKGIDIINKDKEDDHTEQIKKYSDLMLAISSLTTSFNLLTEELKRATTTVKKENQETQKVTKNGVNELKEVVQGKTRIIGQNSQGWWAQWIDSVRNPFKKKATQPDKPLLQSS